MNRTPLGRRPTSTRATSCIGSLIRDYWICRRGAFQLDAVTFRTLLLLLYGAGLRFSEATGLTLADVDLPEAVLTICGTKFYKSRLVPVGPELATVLATICLCGDRHSCAGRDFLPSLKPGWDAARQQHCSGGI